MIKILRRIWRLSRMRVSAHLLCTAYLALSLPSGVDGISGQCPKKRQQIPHHADEATCALPVDDVSLSGSWGPWSYRPFCVETDLSGDEVKYCTYTSTYFGRHGLSVVTKPENAAHIATVLDRSLNHSSFPSAETVRNLTFDRPYEVVDFPGKGKRPRSD